MAVPKKRTSHSKKNKRCSQWLKKSQRTGNNSFLLVSSIYFQLNINKIKNKL